MLCGISAALRICIRGGGRNGQQCNSACDGSKRLAHIVPLELSFLLRHDSRSSRPNFVKSYNGRRHFGAPRRQSRCRFLNRTLRGFARGRLSASEYSVRPGDESEPVARFRSSVCSLPYRLNPARGVAETASLAVEKQPSGTTVRLNPGAYGL